MKPSSIKSVLLVSALCTPYLPAQDTPTNVREIEQKVLRNDYQNAVHALVGSARDAKGDESRINPELIGKRLQWLAMVGDKIDAGSKKPSANQQDMAESAETLNELAWKMITSPEADARHPEIALKLASIAIELGGEKANLLDTKARALFLLGKKEEAITEQEKAVATATVAGEKSGFEATLAFYRIDPEDFNSAVAELERAVAEKRKHLARIIRTQGVSHDRENATAEMLTKPTPEEKIKSAMSAQNYVDAKNDYEAAQQRLEDFRQGIVSSKGSRADLPDAPQQGNPENDSTMSGAAYNMAKLRTIVIPLINFEDTTLEEAVEFLRKQAVELDMTELNPNRKGLNFVIRGPAASPAPASEPTSGEDLPNTSAGPETARIKNLRLQNVPLAVALKYICDATRYRFKVDDYAVTLVSIDAPEDLFTRTFRVPPDFRAILASGSEASEVPETPSTEASTGSSNLRPFPPLMKQLKSSGINFPEGSSVSLFSSGVLNVTNVPTELDKIELLIAAVATNNSLPKRETSIQPVPVPTEAVPEETGEP